MHKSYCLCRTGSPCVSSSRRLQVFGGENISVAWLFIYLLAIVHKWNAEVRLEWRPPLSSPSLRERFGCMLLLECMSRILPDLAIRERKKKTPYESGKKSPRYHVVVGLAALNYQSILAFMRSRHAMKYRHEQQRNWTTVASGLRAGFGRRFTSPVRSGRPPPLPPETAQAHHGQNPSRHHLYHPAKKPATPKEICVR